MKLGEILVDFISNKKARRLMDVFSIGAKKVLEYFDLDKDGKLDFIAELIVHYNVLYRSLFLSSQAKPGDLVKKSAVFLTHGC